MNKQICSSSCSDSGHQDATQWCRVALDKSNIHNCALTLAAKDKEHGGPDSTCASVGDLNKFLVNAQATTDNGGAGCHKVGTVDFAATFMPPDGMSRWCLSSYKHPEWCTV
jgi:methylsterol monooxygenase